MRSVIAGQRVTWRRVLLGVALLGVVVALLQSPAIHGVLVGMLVTVQHVAVRHEALAAVLVVLSTAAASMLAFFSSWLIVPFAVYTWGPLRTLALVMSGWLLGGAASYALARRFGRSVAHWLALEPLLTRYEEQVSHRTPFALALLFQFALPGEVRGILFGLGRYDFKRYLIALAAADLPLAIATVYAGAAVVQRRPTLVVVVAIAFVLMSGWAWYALQRRLRGVTQLTGDASLETEGVS